MALRSTSHRTQMRLQILVTAALATALSACSTPGPKEKIGTMCFSIKGMPEQEEGFLIRRAAEALSKSGFAYATTGCDGTLVYERFATTQGAEVSTSKYVSTVSRTWNEEGIASLVRAGKPIYQDRPIDLQGYSTKQELLDDLAKSLVRQLAKRFEGTASN